MGNKSMNEDRKIALMAAALARMMEEHGADPECRAELLRCAREVRRESQEYLLKISSADGN